MKSINNNIHYNTPRIADISDSFFDILNKNSVANNSNSWKEAISYIVGYQNTDHNYAIKIGLCDENYHPGTFTLDKISKESKFLEKPVDFNEWIIHAICDEIDIIKCIYPDFYNPIMGKEIIAKIIHSLEINFNDTPPLKNQIFYQEYSDIIRRFILLFLLNNPDIELDVYPHLTRKRCEFIFEVVNHLDSINLNLEDWVRISIAAGLLGIDEKPVHAATSSIDIRTAIKLPADKLYDKTDIERVSSDLINAANSECRIDAVDELFRLIGADPNKELFMVSFPDDYLETIVLLKAYEKILNKYLNLEIFCIPRSKMCGNDATYNDIQEFLIKMPDLCKNKRFHLIPNGPIIGGVNLMKLNEKILDIVKEADFLDVRGARNYEMMQGINKEAFFGFMVCREISESVVGLCAADLPFVYIHQLPGEKSFEGFTERDKRIENGKMLALKTVKDNKLP